MNITKKPILGIALSLIFLIFLSAFVGEPKVLPVDEGRNDQTFLYFRSSLLKAVKERDVKKVMPHIHKHMTLSYGDADGKKTFENLLSGKGNLGDSDLDKYWSDLEETIQLGGVFRGNNAFCSPYIACLRLDKKFDPVNTAFIVRKNVAVFSAPSDTSEILSYLSYNALPILEIVDQSWVKVKLADNRMAFLRTIDFLYNHTKRIDFIKENNTWKMLSFLETN